MSSSRYSQHPSNRQVESDGLSSSDDSSTTSNHGRRHESNGHNPTPNGVSNGEGGRAQSLDSTSSSATSQSEREEVSEPEDEEDPIVDEALIRYMVNIRKRHLKIQKSFESKTKKILKTRHNLFFSQHPEYNREAYDLEEQQQEKNPMKRGNIGSIEEAASRPLANRHTQSTRPISTHHLGLPSAIKMEPQAGLASKGTVVQDKEVCNLALKPIPRGLVTMEDKMKAIWSDLMGCIPIAHRQMVYSNTSKLTSCKNLAVLCQREVRKATYRRLKHTREVPNKTRRATREMLTFWRRNEKEERESRKRAEKEALEKQKLEEEAREAKRQERKLNFLITQTELYGHFVSKRIDPSTKDSQDDKDIGEEVDFNEMDFDDDNIDLEAKARISAQHALAKQTQRTKEFDEGARQRKLEGEQTLGVNTDDMDQMNFQDPSTMAKDSNITQPRMLTCELKSYQIKGLNWLANLYEQGINGILADEMGLGKTVQSISLLAHLAEVHNIWGPFIVIAPASTLHNWQQELTKFAPTLKTLPYWGNVKDRKTLRKFWSQKQLYTKDAPFHVLITSYQLIIADERYFQRIKWQYMVLDEAQAIKSSASARWKTLLNFQCRNRLLLTGTPIQNSMQELWALLHFIMPSLFDSHEEFSEWFSRDIENHAEKNGALDQHQLRRLHMILKPFMLRRVKKNVQHELGEKIELEVKCQLTPRQRQLYASLREKISLSELLDKSRSSLDSDNVESLMNLVIQFRKVCNHPELFERAEVQSPYAFLNHPTPPPTGNFNLITHNPVPFIGLTVPKLMYREGGMLNFPGPKSTYGLRNKLLSDTFSIWNPENIRKSCEEGRAFGIKLLLDLSESELEKVHCFDIATLAHSQTNLFSQIDHNYLRSWADKGQLNQVDVMTPQSLLSSINSTKGLEGIADDYFLTMQAFKATTCYMLPAVAPPPSLYCSDIGFSTRQKLDTFLSSSRQAMLGHPFLSTLTNQTLNLPPAFPSTNSAGFSDIFVPDPAKLIMNSGKLMELDKLLTRLKLEGHRVLLYFQMTKMIDLMEEFLTYRQHSYLRLDGSSKISDRRDLVNDWQSRPDLFIFLLSTRAGGLGINLTAADTVIFYDSDWNPTVDQQAMDRAHRLGQTKQVTVYRLVTQNTIEERILMRAKQKDAIHRVVIAGGDYKPPEMNKREIFSLLMDDETNPVELSPTEPNPTEAQTEPIPDLFDTIAVQADGDPLDQFKAVAKSPSVQKRKSIEELEPKEPSPSKKLHLQD